MWRNVFTEAQHPEVFLDDENIRSLFDRVADRSRVTSAGRLEDVLDAGRALTNASEDEWSRLADRGLASGSEAAFVTVAFYQSAPLAASLGVWGQCASAPSVFEDQSQLDRLSLLADDIGVGQPEASRYDAFRILARRAGLSALAVSGPDLSAVREIDDGVFALAAIMHAVSRRSDAFLPEIAGIDLAFRTIGCFPIW